MRDLLLQFNQELEQSGDDQVPASIAGWVYEDGSGGQYMVIELSEKYQRSAPQDCGTFYDFR